MRILGIDLGSKRIGLAIADDSLRMATGFGVIEYKGREEFLVNLKKIVAEEEIGLIIMGLPKNMNGTDGEKARQGRNMAAFIRESLLIDVQLVDEELTTDKAAREIHAGGGKVGKKRRQIDMIAAAIILQDYLDSLSPQN
jgi:putative Holliday junction resolvase